MAIAEVPNLTCSTCKGRVDKEMSYVPPSPANFPVPVEGGFLKGLATYIVMDNLEFMPMSAKMFVSLLKKSDVKDLDAVLDEIEVDLGVEEVSGDCFHIWKKMKHS
ncbi:hypothetical protein ACOSQ3_033187 [Xanthoceras sorbifolium]